LPELPRSLKVESMQTYFINVLRALIRDEEGQDLIEYTLLMAFIALASAAIFVQAGNSVSSIWIQASNQLANAAIQAGS
jgi:Flp pilus assembly pilin Flp